MPACHKCGENIVWMPTSGGKRMPIDARLRKVQLPSAPGVPPADAFAYTSHLSTCKFKNVVASPDQKTKTEE
jgi:hypothetical protein